MTRAPHIPTPADLDGLPFVDDQFASRRLLAIIAAARHGAARRRELAVGLSRGDADAWLTPSRAYLLNAGSTPMPAMALTSARRGMVTDTLRRLAATVPEWASLLSLPVRFALLHPANGAVSASSRDWPQHVLLAPDAFLTPAELAEQVVHELAHQWLYLIEDIWPLEKPDAPRLTLPSGTRDRSPAEVLGAAHVAATLIRLYRLQETSAAAARVQVLSRYRAGCLDLADTASAHLTQAGTHVAQRLKEEL